MTRETRKMLPDITLSVTVPHTSSLPDQMRLAELLEEEGADIIQTEGGKYSSPTKPGVLGLIEKVEKHPVLIGSSIILKFVYFMLPLC